MKLFKKRSKTDGVKGEIAKIASSIDVLIETNESAVIAKELIKLKDIIKFSYPTENKAVFEVEKKVVNKLDDLKILISAAKSDDKVNDCIKDIAILMAERNSLV